MNSVPLQVIFSDLRKITLVADSRTVSQGNGVVSPENSSGLRIFCGDCSAKTAIHVANLVETSCDVHQSSATAAMNDDTLVPFDLPCRKKLTVDFNGGNQSSNGGLLLLRQAERTAGVCWRLAGTMPD